MKQIKDTDYIFISARIKAMERNLLSRERMDRMLDAPSTAEAVKVLTECGYAEMSAVTAAELERVLADQQQRMMADLGGCAPDGTVVDVFKLRYDYHNAKVLVKAEALGLEEDRLLLPGGRYDREELAGAYRRSDLGACSEIFRKGVARARELLGATGDPQQADFILDRACFEELTALAAASGSKLLRDYAALLIDIANLRACVRAARLDKGSDFLGQVLVSGGTVSAAALTVARGEELAALFQSGRLTEAAAEGAAKAAPGSGPLTDFERLCDDALMDFFRDSQRVSFGLEPILGYLYAREAEATAIRTIVSGRMAGLDSGTIRQRLRRTYC